LTDLHADVISHLEVKPHVNCRAEAKWRGL
jgi:hypothetical protein